MLKLIRKAGYWDDKDMHIYRTAQEIPQFSLTERENYRARDEEFYVYILYNPKNIWATIRGRRWDIYQTKNLNY